MTTLFDPITIGEMTLKNRIVMAPLTRNRSPNGVPNDWTATYYQQRSSAGLIISEGVGITQQGQGYAHVPGLYERAQIDGWRRVTDRVHDAGGKIYAQLWHVGRVSHTSLQPNNQAPVAPSAIQADARTYIIDGDKGEFVAASQPRALTRDEFPHLIDDYRRAAAAAVNDAGFDGVEIHAANGYLLDQFLRANTNQRQDEYGGSLENRARFPLEVVAAVTDEIGNHGVGIRISPVTPANDAHDSDPQPVFDYFLGKLARFPLDYIHIIEGATGGDRHYSESTLAFDYQQLKQAYRDHGGVGYWMANNGYSLATATAAVESGYADLVSFGRLFIANPDLVRRFKENGPLNEPDAATIYGGDDHGYIDYPELN